MILIAVKDRKSGMYNRPTFEQSVPSALRSWEVAANESESIISRFPNDFHLHHLANFDANTGTLEVLQAPVDLGSANDYRRAKAGDDVLPFQKNAN